VGREDVINRKQNLFPHIVRGEGKKIVLFFLPTTQQKEITGFKVFPLPSLI